MGRASVEGQLQNTKGKMTDQVAFARALAFALPMTMDFATMFRRWAHSWSSGASRGFGSNAAFTMSCSQQSDSRNSFKQMLSL
jgi:hypothetical protein